MHLSGRRKKTAAPPNAEPPKNVEKRKNPRFLRGFSSKSVFPFYRSLRSHSLPAKIRSSRSSGNWKPVSSTNPPPFPLYGKSIACQILLRKRFLTIFTSFFQKFGGSVTSRPAAGFPAASGRTTVSKAERIRAKQWEILLYLHILCVFFLSSAVFSLCYNVF